MAGYVISAFGDEIAPDLKTQMDVLEKFGVKHIEMRGVNGRGLVEHGLREARQIRGELDDRGFGVSAVGSPLGKIGIEDDFEPHLELFRHTLEIARVLGTSYIRMFSFRIPEGGDPLRHRDEVFLRWNRFVDEAAGGGIMLVHENEKGIYGDTAARNLELLRTLGRENAGMVFDPANFIQCGEEPYPGAFRLLKDYIEYVHIKDAKYSNRLVVPAGEGDGGIAGMLSELKSEDRGIFLSLEPHLGSDYASAPLPEDSPGRRFSEAGAVKFAVAFHALEAVLRSI